MRAGMTDEPVVIVEHDPKWAERFREEQRLLMEAVPSLVAIEHIGSTAVAGLAAKPIVDIIVGVASPSELDEVVPPVVGAGYTYVAEFEQEMPFRRFFRKVESGTTTCHLHVLVDGSHSWLRHLAFRDVLRVDASARRDYETLKRQLAGRHPNDRDAYTAGKDEFVGGVTQEALRQTQGTIRR